MIPVPATTFFFQIWINNYGRLATEIAWLLMGVELFLITWSRANIDSVGVEVL